VRKAKLNRKESAVLEAFEAGVLQPVGSKKSLSLLKMAAKNTEGKEKRINTRLAKSSERKTSRKSGRPTKQRAA
jgi:predicted DNA binding CopG/RHH family protein